MTYTIELSEAEAKDLRMGFERTIAVTKLIGHVSVALRLEKLLGKIMSDMEDQRIEVETTEHLMEYDKEHNC